MGAGAWGSALAQVLADAGSSVMLWARRPEIADEINTDHRNRRYLGKAILPTAGRAPHRFARSAVAGDAAQPDRVDEPNRRGRDAGQPRQGCRGRHADADEP